MLTELSCLLLQVRVCVEEEGLELLDWMPKLPSAQVSHHSKAMGNVAGLLCGELSTKLSVNATVLYSIHTRPCSVYTQCFMDTRQFSVSILCFFNAKIPSFYTNNAV